jgi:hypothetical protein
VKEGLYKWELTVTSGFSSAPTGGVYIPATSLFRELEAHVSAKNTTSNGHEGTREDSWHLWIVQDEGTATE